MDSGIGTAMNTLVANSIAGFDHDNNGGYVQATYALPTKTKVGASFGRSVIERATVAELRDAQREAWVIGAYHPLTKHLNLVAEYNHLTTEAQTVAAGVSEGKQKTMSLGAILFF
jgi:predicted porin